MDHFIFSREYVLKIHFSTYLILNLWSQHSKNVDVSNKSNKNVKIDMSFHTKNIWVVLLIIFVLKVKIYFFCLNETTSLLLRSFF